MKLLLIYLTSEKDKSKDEYLYAITNSKTLIVVENVILLLLSAILFVLFQFNVIMLLPVAFAIYNFVYTCLNIRKACFLLDKKSPKKQVQFYGDYLFYLINKLAKELSAKGIKEEELKTWTDHYINSFKSDLALKNFKVVCKKIEEHIASISGNEYKLNISDFQKYRKKQLKAEREKLFPELQDLINQEKISIKIKHTASTVGNSDEVQQNLRLLGLSANTKKFDVVTQRYYELVKIYHPDRSKNVNAEKKLSEINKAYMELKRAFKNKN